MGIPRGRVQVKRAPLLALRSVFAGVGRLVMLADRQEPVIVIKASGPEAPPPPAELPLPNYDALSLPSIRARLRGLDAAQLKVLLDYEAVNAERTDVLGMLERRIEKLEAGP